MDTMLGIHELRLFIISGLLLWCFGVAACAASAAGRIRRSGRTLLWINRTLGGLFVCLGIRVALLQAR
jgi:threonine/homoserine/homoserine lactone efflux protein